MCTLASSKHTWETRSLQITVITVLIIIVLVETFCVWLNFTMLAAPLCEAGCSY